MAWQTRPRKFVPEQLVSLPEERPRRKVAPFLTGFPTRFGCARGLYRVFNAAVYRFYRGSVPPVEGDAPYATSATLPATPATTFADGTWYLSMSYFDGVLDSGFLPVGTKGETYLVLTIASGVLLATPPSAPMAPRLEVRAGGVIRVIAGYVPAVDGVNAATQWAITYTTDGSTPTSGPGSAPTLAPAMSTGNGMRVLSLDLPAQADGTRVNVQLQTRRLITGGGGAYAYSPAAKVLSAVADAAGPGAVLSVSDWAGSIEDDGL